MDELVNIPALLLCSDGGTQSQSLSVSMVCALIASRNDFGKSGSPIPRGRQKTKPTAESIQIERLPRKTSRANTIATVP